MKFKFEYLIDRDDDNKIIDRSVQITITSKTSDLAELALYNLAKHLNQEGYNFSGCPYNIENEYGDTIIVDNKEEADHIKKLYKEWKKIYKSL